jgi:hypothetical protein
VQRNADGYDCPWRNEDLRIFLGLESFGFHSHGVSSRGKICEYEPTVLVRTGDRGFSALLDQRYGSTRNGTPYRVKYLAP